MLDVYSLCPPNGYDYREAMSDNHVRLLIAALGLSASLALAWTVRDRLLMGQNDFIPIYVSAQQAVGGEVYQTAPYADFVANQFSARSSSLLFTRPPFYALLVKPLGLLDYNVANFSWIGLRLLAVAGFLWLMRVPTWADAAMLTFVSLPLSASLMNGQDVALLLPAIAASLVLEKRRKSVWAGAVLSLCSIKFHLFLLIPVLLLASKRRDIAAGFGIGAVCQLALSFAAAGLTWPLDYFSILMMDSINPEIETMPNLHGLVSGLPGATWIEFVGIVAIVAVSWVIFRKFTFDVGLSVALVGGLLTSYHAYMADAVILLPAFLVLHRHLESHLLKGSMVILLFPPAWLILLGDRPASYGPQIAILAIFAAACWQLIAGHGLSTEASKVVPPQTVLSH